VEYGKNISYPLGHPRRQERRRELSLPNANIQSLLGFMATQRNTATGKQEKRPWNPAELFRAEQF